MSQLYYPLENFTDFNMNNVTLDPYTNIVLSTEDSIKNLNKLSEDILIVKKEIYTELHSDVNEILSEISNEITDEKNKDNVEENHTLLKRFNDLLHEFKEEFKDIQNKFVDTDKILKNEINKSDIDIKNLETMINFVNNIDKSYSEEEEVKKINENIILLSNKIKNNNKIKEAKQSYCESRVEINKYLDIIKSFNNMNCSSTCSLCLTNKVEEFINPCGHCFCTECKDRLINYERTITSACCPICRGNVLDFKKLYL